MTAETVVTSVSTDIAVDVPIERAFHVFTAEIGTWWDADKHILDAPLADMVFQPWVGGNIIDRGVDGTECRWARILAYEPPTLVCFSWDINTRWQIEEDPEKTSEVEITFAAEGPARTRVVLTHRYLDRHGEGWEGMRDAVNSGWSLAHFAEVAAIAESARCQPFVFMVLHYPTPENSARLAQGMADMRATLRSQPGCLGVDPPLLTEDGTCLVGYSRWQSKDAFLATGITLGPANETIEGELRPRQRFLLNAYND
jgi:uncharacterized protein YndB with AHSA1/START domain